MNPAVLIVGRGATPDGQRWIGIHCDDFGTDGGGCHLVEIEKTMPQGDWLKLQFAPY